MSDSGARKQKTLVIIRHAHRDTSNRSLDNGLSEKGRRQRARLTDYFTERFSGHVGDGGSILVLSSPKQRCRQTVDRIAEAAGTQVRPDARLDECGPMEGPHAFRTRIEGFLQWWSESGPDLTVVCSHGDWIPQALEMAVGARAESRKGSWAEVRLIDGRPTLCWLIQTFKGWRGPSG